MAAFIDRASRGLYTINDLSLDEMFALLRAIGHADLPDRGTLEPLRRKLDMLPRI